MRQHAGVFGSLLVVAAIVSGLALGVLALIDRAATAGVRSELASRTGEDGALRVALRATGDVASADAAVRAAVAEGFRGDGRVVPLTVHHEVRSGTSVPFTRTDGTSADNVIVASIPDLEHGATLSGGSWAVRDDEATLQADAAEALGLEVGDRIEVGGAQLTLVGTWRIDDGLDPRWAGDAVVVRGTDGRRVPSFGVLDVQDPVWEGLATARTELWTIVPDTASFEPADLATVAIAWNGFDTHLKRLGIGEGVEQGGHFGLTARELDRQVGALDATGPASLLLVAMIALVTFVELGRLLTEVRTRELGLLWARGATPREVALATAVETALTATLGAALGVGAAVALVAVGDAEGFARLGSSWVVIPLVVVLGAVLAVAVQALLGTRRSARLEDPGHSARGQRVAGAGVVVLVTLAAALATWQLRLYGSPVTPDAAGGSSVDAIAVTAPTFVVVAVVLAALLLFPRIARIVERGAARDPRAAAALAARSVARRLALAATPIALVALAASQLLVAAGFAGSWERSQAQAHSLRAGSELRVDAGPAGLSESEFTTLSGLDGLERLAPVTSDVIDLGDEQVRVVGVAADAVRELTLDGGGTIDPAALADHIRADPMGAALPRGDTLTLHLAPDQPVELGEVALWLQTDDGLTRRVDAHVGSQPDAYLATLPAAPAGTAWHLIGIDLVVPFFVDKDVRDDGLLLTIETAEVDGVDAPLGTGWYGIDLVLDSPLLVAGNNTSRLAMGTSARFLPPTGPDASVPVVISRDVAATMNARIGSVLSLPFSTYLQPVTVAAIVDGIPGSDRSQAILIDAQRLTLTLLRADDQPPRAQVAWVAADDPVRAASELRAALRGSSRVVLASVDPVSDMLTTAALVLWVTAIGSAVLALAALGAVVGAQLRSRRDETAVLRALGFAAREQGALRRRELLAVVGYGALVGVVAGALVVIVVIAVFVRAAVPDSYSGIPTEVSVDAGTLGIALGALALAALAFVAGYGGLVARQARGARVPEDTR
ncbi:MAG: FtsX-like permease family protein [Protaetiibacter sp.]